MTVLKNTNTHPFSASYQLVMLILVAVVVIAAVGPLQAVEVRKDRPRMLITAEDVEPLRAKCKGPAKEMFQAMKQRADEKIEIEATLDNQGRFYLPTYAAMYVITNELQYADKAKQWLDLLSKNTIQDSWTCLEYIPVAAIAYDWIYPTLTDDEKSRFADGLIRQVERIKELWRHSDYNNHFLLEYMSELHVALTLANEDHHQDIWKAYLAETDKWLKENVVVAMNEMAGQDGGDAEGFGYSNWGVSRPLSLHLLSWRSATGEDLFEKCSFMRGMPRWNIYGRKPNGTQCRSEDSESTHSWDQGVKATFAICAAAYGDRYAQWAHNQIEPEFPHLLWRHLIPWDQTVVAKSPSDLPLATVFRPLGNVYTRSAWNNPAASWAMFQCGPIFAGHQHTDNNSFVIFKKASLAIDSGVYDGSPHRPNYHSRSIAHNTVLIYDKDETFPSSVWSDEGTGGSNDGGQRRVNFPVRATATPEEKAVRDVGKIIAFQNRDQYSYACGDATKSYSAKKLKHFTRQFVHLRPDTFVVFDRVIATSPSYPKTWLLHSIDKPIFDDQDSSFAIEQGDGRLDVWTLLPKETKAETIGGEGKEYWVDGKNYPPSGSDPEAGAWRVEVIPTKQADKHLFLHVLHASDADHPGPLPKVTLKSADEKTVTVEIADKTGKSTLTFNADGEVGGNIRITKNGVEILSEPLSQKVVLP